MKHPQTGKYLIELTAGATAEAMHRSDITVYHDRTGASNGNFVSSEDARKLSGYGGMQPYAFNDENDPIVQIDYEGGVVYSNERGGWGITRTVTFADLEDLAELWEVEFDVGATTEEAATMAYKLIYAEHSRVHNIDYTTYLPTPSHRFLPPLPEPKIEGSVYHEEHKIMYRAPVHFTAEQMLAYGEECVRKALQRD